MERRKSESEGLGLTASSFDGSLYQPSWKVDLEKPTDQVRRQHPSAALTKDALDTGWTLLGFSVTRFGGANPANRVNSESCWVGERAWHWSG